MKSSETLPLLVDTKRSYHEVPVLTNSRISHHYVPLSAKELEKTYDSREDRHPSENSLAWVGFVLVAFLAMCFAASFTAAGFLQLRTLLTSAQAGYLMSITLLLFSSIYIIAEWSRHNISFKISRNTLLWLILRGLMGASTITCLMYSLRYIPIGDSDAIYYLSPAITICLSRPLLGEPISFVDTMAAVLGFTGAFIVACPNSNDHLSSISTSSRIIGSAFAFGAALSNSIGMVVVRAVVRNTHFMLSIFSLAVFGTILTALLGGTIPISVFFQIDLFTVMCFVVGVFSFVGQMTYNYGFRFCPASTGSVIRNLEIPSSYLLSLILLHDPISGIRLFGASLVLVSSVLVLIQKLLDIRKVPLSPLLVKTTRHLSTQE